MRFLLSIAWPPLPHYRLFIGIKSTLANDMMSGFEYKIAVSSHDFPVYFLAPFPHATFVSFGVLISAAEFMEY